MNNILTRIEWRTWYVDGKYLGNKSPWMPADRAALAKERTGNFYGEYSGTRFHDGEKELVDHEKRCIELHSCNAYKEKAVMVHTPIPRGDWGEYRFVTSLS